MTHPSGAAPRAATASLLVAFAACCFGSISILTVVATLVDVTGLLIYFTVALAILKGTVL